MKAFTMLELIFILVIIGILAAVAVPRYFMLGDTAHESNLISFTKTLNRTTGEDLWGRSISMGKGGSIKNLASNEDYQFLKKYVTIPIEIDKSSIDLSKCGTGTYEKIMEANVSVTGAEYIIECKDGTPTTAPYFKLIRKKDNKVLVSRD